MEQNVIKQEIKIGDESVKNILATEVAKIIVKDESVFKALIEKLMFARPPKHYSFDKDKPTLFETCVDSVLKGMIKEEIKNVCNENRAIFSRCIKVAFGTKVANNKDFEKRLIEKMSEFTSNINFYTAKD